MKEIKYKKIECNIIENVRDLLINGRMYEVIKVENGKYIVDTLYYDETLISEDYKYVPQYTFYSENFDYYDNISLKLDSDKLLFIIEGKSNQYFLSEETAAQQLTKIKDEERKKNEEMKAKKIQDNIAREMAEYERLKAKYGNK